MRVLRPDLDYLHEVEHVAGRIGRLEQAIEEAVKLAPPRMQEVIQALQALRGVAQISAVTLVAELGEISRFERARQTTRSTLEHLFEPGLPLVI